MGEEKRGSIFNNGGRTGKREAMYLIMEEEGGEVINVGCEGEMGDEEN